MDIATQALLKSLRYDPRGQDTVQQTKAGKYDAYASKKDVEVQTQDRIELSVKMIEELKRHGSGP